MRASLPSRLSRASATGRRLVRIVIIAVNSSSSRSNKNHKKNNSHDKGEGLVA